MILHIIIDSPISNEYIKFISVNFETQEHHFFCLLRGTPKYLEAYNNLRLSKFQNDLLTLIMLMQRVQKIILHGIFDLRVYYALFLTPWLLKKCYWVIWGADLYLDYEKRRYKRSLKYKLYFGIKKYILSKIYAFITYIEGDYRIAQKIFCSRAKYLECIMYPSNIYKDRTAYNTDIDEYRRVTVGNSASIGNQHLKIFQKLKDINLENYLIYCPLSYGDAGNQSLVVEKGKDLFGDKFIPLLKIMKIDDYYKFLSSIDIAIYNHKHQEGMGNILTLLGMGKAVAIRDDITPWELFKKLGIRVFSTNHDLLDFDLMLSEDLENNIKLIKQYFNEENLIKQLRIIFNE